MSASWVTAAIEAGSNEIAIRVGAGNVLVACGSGDGPDNAGPPTPLELLLASLGACTAFALKEHAASRRWSLDVVEVDLEIVRRQSSASVTRLLSLQGALDPSQREELLAIAERSPVTVLLAPGVRIHTELA
jgi:putative redox protein